MERCERCMEPVGDGFRCKCQRDHELAHAQAEVARWVALVDDENTRLDAEGKDGKMKAGFDGMKVLARAGRLNIPDLEERAAFRRNASAEIIGDPLQKAKWRRPRMLPPKSVYKEII